MADNMFPTSIDPAEQGAGFSLIQIPNPQGHYFMAPKTIDVVGKELGAGLIAVKAIHPAGGVVYAIWDAKTHRPVQEQAGSLAELAARFP
jgi:hypothetical protein